MVTTRGAATQRLLASEGYQQFLALPPQHGYYRLTPRRLGNLYLRRLEHLLARKHLRSNPVKLTVDSTNVCNLRCPGVLHRSGCGRARARRYAPNDCFNTSGTTVHPGDRRVTALNVVVLDCSPVRRNKGARRAKTVGRQEEGTS